MGRKFADFTVTAEEHSSELLQESGQLGEDVALALTDTDQQLIQQTATQDEGFTGVIVGDSSASENEQVMELETLNGGIQETFDAVYQFEDLLDIAQRAEKGEGLSDDAAQLVEMTHENLVKRLSLTKGSGIKSPVLSLENYRSKYSRKGATTITVATLEANFKEIVVKIKQAILRAWNIIQQTISDIAKNALVIKGQVKILETQLFSLKKKDSTMTHTELVKSGNGVRIGSKADAQTAGQILMSAKALIEGSANMADALRSFDVNGSWFTQTSSMVQRVVTSLGQGGSAGSHGHFGQGKSLSFSINEDSTVSIGFVETGNPVQSAKAPSIDEMLSIVKQTYEVADELAAFQKLLPSFKRSSEEVIKTVDGIVSDNNDDTERKEETRRSIRSAIDLVTYFGSSVPRKVYEVLRYTTAFLTEGVNNYGQRVTAQ